MSSAEQRCSRCGGLLRVQLMGTLVCTSCGNSEAPKAPPASNSMSFDSVLGRIAPRFISGNSVPVERAHITADEWSVLVAELARLRGIVERNKTSAVHRLHNLCDGLAEDADKSPFTREEWERVDKQTVRLQKALRELADAAENTLRSHPETECCAVTRMRCANAREVLKGLPDETKADPDELAWLIEFTPFPDPLYLSADGSFDRDSFKAVRFSRKQDAEAMLGYMQTFCKDHGYDANPRYTRILHGEDCYRVTEHMWCSQSKAATPRCTCDPSDLHMECPIHGAEARSVLPPDQTMDMRCMCPARLAEHLPECPLATVKTSGNALEDGVPTDKREHQPKCLVADCHEPTANGQAMCAEHIRRIEP